MPAKYRKKPVEVEAVQLRWDTWSEICDFVGVSGERGKPSGCYVGPDGKALDKASVSEKLGLSIPTLEGTMLAQEGDWIVKGVKGEFYPVKPDIFEATYDKV